jgi:hypothetical protein
MVHLSNPAIQMAALLALAGLIFCISVFVSIRAYRKLKGKDKSISEIAEDGERTKTLLERYTGNIFED